MSNSIGDQNGNTAVAEPDVGEGSGGEQSYSDIFQAEVEAIKAEEERRENPDALRDQGTQDPAGGSEASGGGEENGEQSLSADGPGDAEAGGDSDEGGDSPEGATAEAEGSDPSGETGEGEGDEESEGSVKKKRTDWKKEALESRTKLQEVDSLKSELAEIKDLLRQSKTPETSEGDDPEATKPSVEIPKIDINDPNLSQELKDLLEYTPGLDTMLTSLVAQTAEAILEKKESEKAAELQQQTEAQKQQEADQKYWNDMDGWLSGQYPELSLSDIRNSPDFKDWLNIRKTWVDTQLSSSAWDDISGAQKVFERYIKENNLAGEPPQEPSKRNLAAARTPPANRRAAPTVQGERNLFQEEAKRLQTSRRNYTI